MGWRAAVAGTVALLLVAGVLIVRIQSRGPSEVVSLSDFDMTMTSAGEGEGDDPKLQQSQTSSLATDDTAATEDSALTLVHVAGAVQQPGIVRLPSDSRVYEAIDEAGGAVKDADLTQVNLARAITDGEQLIVPHKGESIPTHEAPGLASSSGPASSGSATSGDGAPGSSLLEINAAAAADFERLPGIGPVLAERIVSHRDLKGGFGSVDELAEVSGIGPSIMGQIRDLVRV